MDNISASQNHDALLAETSDLFPNFILSFSIGVGIDTHLKNRDIGFRMHLGEFTPAHIPATIYDVTLPIGEDITVPTKEDETVFVFLIEGNAVINNRMISSKSAVLFGDGDYITVSAHPESGLRFIFFSGKALHEPIAWGGPIVMNTQEELMTAFSELQNDTFIKHS